MPVKIRLVARGDDSSIRTLIVTVLSIFAALLFCALFITAQGFDPIAVYSRLFRGGFGSWEIFSESVLQSIPLMLCGLGTAMSLKMSISNIGAEGQFLIGALCTSWIALFAHQLPSSVFLLVALLFGFLGGALWSVLATAPRAFLNVNETIVTLMFNYIALYLVDYFCYGPWRDSAGSNMPYTEIFPANTHLKTFGETRIHSGILIALVAAILIQLFYKYTSRGYQVCVIGANQAAARYAGMNLKYNILLIMFLSGGLAGLAGGTYVTGVVHRLQPNLAGGAGYTTIIIAYLAKFNPFAVLIIAILFGGLNQGGYSAQVMGFSYRIVTFIQGAILLFVLAGEIFTRRNLRISIRKASNSETR